MFLVLSLETEAFNEMLQNLCGENKYEVFSVSTLISGIR